MPTKEQVNIIGAGLAGSLLAVGLAQKGFQVDVYERRPDMRKVELAAGRSINLALSIRGMHALEKVGLLEEIMKIAIPMRGRMMHGTDGSLTFQSYSKDQKDCIYSVSRGELNQRLMSLAESYEGVRFHFNQMCTHVDTRKGIVSLTDTQTGSLTHLEEGVHLACDGAYSAIRYAMIKTPRFNLVQSHLAHGYKELTIPAGVNGSFQIEKHALHIWPRGSFMMIALPNLDGSFTCTLFFPYEGEYGFDQLTTPEKVMTLFEEQFPDAIPLIPDLTEEFFSNPTGSLVTIRCYPWALSDKILLLGDASHAIVPFFGQGMNAAFEDCAEFGELLDQHGNDWSKLFDTFQKQRKPNAEAIADMALENFIEMRDHVGNTEFLFRKKVEHLLGRTFPSYKARYECVSFSRIPYKEAYELGERNDKILSELTEGIDTLEQIDLNKAEKLINKYLL